MKKIFRHPLVLTILLSSFLSSAFAKDFVIYSISQDLPMGIKDEVLRKNFYVDMGKNQGVKKGSILDVYRVVSVLDPYESKKRFNHKIKIGELKIIHSEDTSAIGTIGKYEEAEETPVLDIGKLMIGDIVTAHIK